MSRRHIRADGTFHSHLSYVSIFQTADYPLSPRVCARKQQRGEMEGRGDAGMLALIGLLCHTHRALLTVTRMPEGRVLQVVLQVVQRSNLARVRGQKWYLTRMSEHAKKEIISGFPGHYLSRGIVLCHDTCYMFLFMAHVRVMVHVMVHVSCIAGRRGWCIHALWRGRAPRAVGMQPLDEQDCATRGGWRTVDYE